MPDPAWIDDLAGVPHELVLWRGITPELTEPDALTGRTIPRDGAFRTQQLSMNVRGEIDMATMLAKKDGWRLWCLTAKQVRDYGCIIVRDPEGGDTSHVLALREDRPGERLTGGMANKMRRNGYWEDEGPPQQTDAPPVPDVGLGGL